MIDEERKKLNDKLLEFAGFTKDGEFRVVGPAPSHKVIETPDFTDPNIGIAHCLRWLVPKLFTWSLSKNWEIQKDFSMKANGVIASVDLLPIDPDKYDEIKPSQAIAETPAVAFCLAVETQIDAKKD